MDADADTLLSAWDLASARASARAAGASPNELTDAWQKASARSAGGANGARAEPAREVTPRSDAPPWLRAASPLNAGLSTSHELMGRVQSPRPEVIPGSEAPPWLRASPRNAD